MPKTILILGSFVADLAFRTPHLPAWGETLMGSAFAVGPGGKGSNQAVAAARALAGRGIQVQIFSKLGRDPFAQLARTLWNEAAIDHSLTSACDTPTGAAAILIDQAHGENAIIVVPGACFTLTPAEVDAAAPAIRAASVFLTQLELPLDTVTRALELARSAGIPTLLNPAPAIPLPDHTLALADFLIPNESEAAALTGLPVTSIDEAKAAALALQSRGARTVILTLGAQGALVCPAGEPPTHIQAFHAGPVVETTGAGDAFCGALAAALSQQLPLLEAVRFACAAAGLSVTRAGTAPSMPHRVEILHLLNP
jgi:ribokinase